MQPIRDVVTFGQFAVVLGLANDGLDDLELEGRGLKFVLHVCQWRCWVK